MSDVRNDAQSASAGTADAARDADSVKETVGNLADSTRDTSASLIDQAKGHVRAALSDQKDGVADRIDQLAETVHQSAAQFEGKQDWIASAIDRGAVELGALANALRENDLAGLLDQAGAIARKQPALFIGASLAAGFAAARLGRIVVADVSRDDLPTVGESGHAPA